MLATNSLCGPISEPLEIVILVFPGQCPQTKYLLSNWLLSSIYFTFFYLIESSDDIGEIIYILHMKKGSERPSDLLHVTPQIRGKASI